MTRSFGRFGRGPPGVSRRTRSGPAGPPSASSACAGCCRPTRTGSVRPSEGRGREGEGKKWSQINKSTRVIEQVVKSDPRGDKTFL